MQSFFKSDHMPTKQKSIDKQSFQKEYVKLTKEYKEYTCPPPNPQWTSPGDFFVKFSIYQETSSGSTSSETSLITSV